MYILLNRTLRKFGILFIFCIVVFALPLSAAQGTMNIGWSSGDITPSKGVILRGQLYPRFSEGVMDPIGVTALALESVGHNYTAQAVLVSCDLIIIPDTLRDLVRKLVTIKVPALAAADITLNATHTHTGPLITVSDAQEMYGIPFEWLTGGKEAMTPKEYLVFAAERITDVVIAAWMNKKPGGISYGLSKAVVGQNRLQASKKGKSIMYGDTGRPEFSHIEGYEDHNLNLLYTWDTSGKLTGVVINIAVPAQVSEKLFVISADFWKETRDLLRQEVETDLFILPQVSAAGDQSPHSMWDTKAEERMQELMGGGKDEIGRGSIGRRKQIARYITDGVKAIIPYMKEHVEWDPLMEQKTVVVPISRRLLGNDDLEPADEVQRTWKAKYEAMLADVTEHPDKRNTNRWYQDITLAYAKSRRGQVVHSRYRLEKKSPKLPVEIKAIRLGDMVIVSNPFELYLDYGIQIKVKSPAVQTFIVQLTGSGSYLPTQRSIEGGAYGAVPASTIVGPEGGYELVDKTVELINSLWESEE